MLAGNATDEHPVFTVKKWHKVCESQVIWSLDSDILSQIQRTASQERHVSGQSQ